jgi:hypothetical protein
VTTPAGDEVGATGVFVGEVMVKVVGVGAGPPIGVVPDRKVDGAGVLTITVVEVTVLEDPGRGVVGAPGPPVVVGMVTGGGTTTVELTLG